MEICRLESNGYSRATNWKDSHRGCSGSFGLFQIGCLHGYSMESLHNPLVNIRVAYALWKENGWAPWTTYKLLAYDS